MILQEALGLTYQLLPVNIMQGDQHTAAYVRQVPTRKVPALRHRNTGVGQIVFERVRSCCIWQIGKASFCRKSRFKVAVPAMAVLAGRGFEAGGGASPLFSSLCQR